VRKAEPSTQAHGRRAFALTPAWTQATPLVASTTSGNDFASRFIFRAKGAHFTTNTQASVENDVLRFTCRTIFGCRRNLTPNLRSLDIQTAPTERYNRLRRFDLTLNTTLASQLDSCCLAGGGGRDASMGQ